MSEAISGSKHKVARKGRLFKNQTAQNENQALWIRGDSSEFVSFFFVDHFIFHRKTVGILFSSCSHTDNLVMQQDGWMLKFKIWQDRGEKRHSESFSASQKMTGPAAARRVKCRPTRQREKLLQYWLNQVGAKKSDWTQQRVHPSPPNPFFPLFSTGSFSDGYMNHSIWYVWLSHRLHPYNWAEFFLKSCQFKQY